MASDENIEYVLVNAPSEISREEVIKAIEDNNGNTVDAIASLWNINKKQEEMNETQSLFKDIRESCDSYDKQMEKFVISNKNKNLLKETLMK